MTTYEDKRNEEIKKNENLWLKIGKDLDQYATVHYPETKPQPTIGYGYDIKANGFTDDKRTFINSFIADSARMIDDRQWALIQAYPSGTVIWTDDPYYKMYAAENQYITNGAFDFEAFFATTEGPVKFFDYFRDAPNGGLTFDFAAFNADRGKVVHGRVVDIDNTSNAVNKITEAEYKSIVNTIVMTEAEATAMLNVTIKKYEDAIDLIQANTTRKLTSDERAGFVSMMYNMVGGTNGAAIKTAVMREYESAYPRLMDYLNSSDPAIAAAGHLKFWFEMRYRSNGEQTVNTARRRNEESDLFGLFKENSELEYRAAYIMLHQTHPKVGKSYLEIAQTYEANAAWRDLYKEGSNPTEKALSSQFSAAADYFNGICLDQSNRAGYAWDHIMVMPASGSSLSAAGKPASETGQSGYLLVGEESYNTQHLAGSGVIYGGDGDDNSEFKLAA